MTRVSAARNILPDLLMNIHARHVIISRG